ncbi:MAG: UDP-N-acetylmuramoyl-tripeptide--D-alanyl-D-alanine ligase [Bacteroidota bacterium]
MQSLYEKFLQHPVICTDTRKLSNGCLFFALKGDNFNGNKFADQALKEGAAYVIVDEKEYALNDQCIFVDDVLTALQQLASYHRKQLNIPVIALTGSNGKTTSKELIASVLKQKFNVLYTLGNLNNHIGVPLTLLQLTAAHEMAVIEMGANHQKEIELLCNIANPDYGLITNVGKAHLEGFGGFEGVKKGKGELYQYIKQKKAHLFVNVDNGHLVSMLNAYDNVTWYGTISGDVQGVAAGESSLLDVQVNHPFNQYIKTNLTGDYNLENILAAVAIGDYFKINQEEIKKGIESYFPSNQRSQIIKKANNITLVLDAYNANPSSMNAALDNFDKSFSGKKIIALGDMLELGSESEREHFNIAQKVAGFKDTFVVLVGPKFESAAKKFYFRHFKTSAEAAAFINTEYFRDYTILIKGSRGIKMEVIAELI